MSRHEELALQTQLLLQEASQVAQHAAADADEAAALVDGEAPAVSELEAAKQSLLDKLKRKKEARAAQLLALGSQRYGFQRAGGDGQEGKAAAPRLTPVKGKAFKPPVATSAAPAGRKKKDLLLRLRQQAVRQGEGGVGVDEHEVDASADERGLMSTCRRGERGQGVRLQIVRGTAREAK